MDDADRAGPEIDRYILEAARQKKPTGPVANGRCHWCDDIVGDTDRWCSTDCIADWNRAIDAQKRRGFVRDD
jgi:hypothetical protein